MVGILMKSRTHNVVTGDERMEWHFIRSPFLGAIRKSHAEAMEMIRTEGLVCVYEKDREKIYSDPNEDFKARWHGTPEVKMRRVNEEVQEKNWERNQ